jgi:uncharacterized integral membrane protein
MSSQLLARDCVSPVAHRPWEDEMQEPSRSGSKLGGGAIASLVGIAVLVIFIVQNTEDVKFDFLFVDFTWPLWLYTIVVALFGALVWFGLGVVRRHRRREARRESR